MCIRLTRIYNCSDEDHTVHHLVRCSTPMDPPQNEYDTPEQWCLMLPTECTEYKRGVCGDCRGDVDGLPGETVKRQQFEPFGDFATEVRQRWLKEHPGLHHRYDKLLEEEESGLSGPSYEYAQRLARFLYYIMTQIPENEDQRRGIVTVPDHIHRNPAVNYGDWIRKAWMERYKGMLPELCCRFEPQHGALYGLGQSSGGHRQYVFGHRATCDCAAMAMPFLNNPLAHVRSNASSTALMKMLMDVDGANHAWYLRDLFQAQESHHRELRKLSETFKKRPQAIREHLKINQICPSSLLELAEKHYRDEFRQEMALLESDARGLNGKMARLCIRAGIMPRQMTTTIVPSEVNVMQDKRLIMDELVIPMICRDAGLSMWRQERIINVFMKNFVAFNPRCYTTVIEVGRTEDYLFRLAYILTREVRGRMNSPNRLPRRTVRNWVRQVSAGTHRVQLHTLYPETYAKWSTFMGKYDARFKYVTDNIVEARWKDMVGLDEGEQSCPICGDDLQALLVSEGKDSSKRKIYLRPAQGLACYEQKNKHWCCRPCLVRHGMTMKWDEAEFPEPSCVMCREPFNPAHSRYLKDLPRHTAEKKAQEARDRAALARRRYEK
ncbi:hypothetical protein V8F33_004537 [Rhypophila sp. PSN 637]